jgi:putative ABC transport system permease protein
VLIGVKPGADPQAVAAQLKAALPDVFVRTGPEFEESIVNYVLRQTAIGITFGTSTVFALIVGFVIVSLSMLSSVVDNLREFGTLKAIGTTNWDLTKLLFVQSMTYAVIGSVIGLGLVTRVAGGIRSPKLAMLLPPQLVFGSIVVMCVLCVLASSLALLRIRKLEPAMVFR